MENSTLPLSCTLEDLRDPEKRAAYEQVSTVKSLQKELLNAIDEAKETIESFKQLSNNCNQELIVLREVQERDISQIIPAVQIEVERLTDYLRSEMVSQTSENLKLNKLVQGLVKESLVIQQLTSESTWKFDKAESSMQIK